MCGRFRCVNNNSLGNSFPALQPGREAALHAGYNIHTQANHAILNVLIGGFDMKLTVIGGGGVRSMFLAKSIAQQASSLGIDELVFMDNDPEKLRIYGGLAAHVSGMLCPTLNFSLTGDAVEAVKDADYVITTIRVGGDHMRVRDERIALSHGVLGQETTGAAGVSFAMRSVPALASYCELIKKYAKPDVKVFNFTNPAGVVSQALRDMGYDFTYGICDAPSACCISLPSIKALIPHRFRASAMDSTTSRSSAM